MDIIKYYKTNSWWFSVKNIQLNYGIYGYEKPDAKHLGVGGPQHLVEGRQTAHVEQVVFRSSRRHGARTTIRNESAWSLRAAEGRMFQEMSEAHHYGLCHESILRCLMENI